MEKFKPIDIDDREIFSKYLKNYSFNTYEYSFLTLYLWRKMLNTEYCIMDDYLIIRKSNNGSDAYFMQPVGCSRENSLKDLVLKLNGIKKINPEFGHLFKDVEASFLSKLMELFGNDLIVHEDINNFDYVYNSKSLITLSGKKYHKKKNHYNQFINSYNYEIRDLDNEQVIKDCIGFSRAWYESKTEKYEQLKYELESVEDVLPKAGLLNIKGIAVYVNNRVVGFSFGEQVNDDMALVHFEKGDVDYTGIYAFINKTLVERHFSGVSFVNRQEDLGIEGLRKAKMSYHPVRMEKKYIVDLS